MKKFGRNYRLSIYDQETGEVIIIEPPLSIFFNITRNSLSSVNGMQLQIFNLKEDTRNKIFQDRFNPKVYKRIVLEAGYDTLSVVFAGNIFIANSSREKTEIVTFIDCRDGIFDTINTLSFKTISKNTTQKELVENLIGDFPNITKGVIGELEGTIKRPAVISGNTYDYIHKYTADLDVFIDNEKINVIKKNETLPADIPLINSDTGLIETPKRNDAYLTIKTIFEPRINVGQFLEIESSIQKQYNGQYKVIGVNHSGSISQASAGSCISTFELLVESQLFGKFNEVSE